MLYLWKKNLTKLSKIADYWKIKDNCHYTGKYKGATSRTCNLKFNVPNEIPAVFHNS